MARLLDLSPREVFDLGQIERSLRIRGNSHRRSGAEAINRRRGSIGSCRESEYASGLRCDSYSVKLALLRHRINDPLGTVADFSVRFLDHAHILEADCFARVHG